MPVAFVPLTNAPTHLGAFRLGPFGTAATYVPPGQPLLPALLGGVARYVVEAAFGANLGADPTTWQWYDITADVLIDTAQVTIGQGRINEVSLTSPASCTFQLDNTSGAYSPYQPTAQWWPYARRNTPIRVRITPDGSTAAATWFVRFQGYANGFTPSWNTVSREPTVTVSASGILRRLQQGKTPLRSALYRALNQPRSVSYWSMEDGPSATRLADAVSGNAMVFSGNMGLGSATGLAGSAALATPAPGSSARAAVAPFPPSWNPAVTGDGWSVLWMMKIPRQPAADTLLMEWFSADTGAQHWQVYITAAGNIITKLFNAAGAELLGDTGIGFNSVKFDGVSNYGQWLMWTSSYSPFNGTDADLFTQWGVAGHSISDANTLIGHLPGAITSMAITGAAASADSFSLGHLTVQPTTTTIDAQVAYGYVGETVTARMARLCLEEGVPFAVVGTSTTLMGAQTPETLHALLRECEATDGGLLVDGFGPGLLYLTRTSRYNQPASMTLDAAADEVGYPFAPIDDDQRNRNLCKVDQKNGSSAVYEDVPGALGTAAIGTYDTSLAVNPSNDSGLYYQAAWEVRRGTIEGLRYPTVSLDLAAIPQRVPDWLTGRVTERVDVANVTTLLPAHPPGTASLAVEGWVEAFDNFRWQASVNCSPVVPWNVGVLGTDRLDATGSTIATTAAAGSGSLSVASTGQVWSTAPGDYPLDFYIGGQRVTVTAVSGSSSPQTFTVTPATVTSQLNPGDTVRLWSPLYPAL